MRVLVLGLLLVNLLFFGWAEWIDVPAPPAPSSIAGLRPLTLVKELPPDKRAALAKKMSLATSPVCVSLGPFDDAGVAAKAVALLQAQSFTPQQRTAQSPAIPRIWVYLDGFVSDTAVTRVLHRLEHGGIDDAEAMPAEAGHRRISLGLYSDRDRADARVRAVRALGLKPQMGQRTVPGTAYWLDLKLPNSGVSVSLKDVSDLEPAGNGDSSPIRVQPCPTVAAPPASPAATPAAAPAAKNSSPPAPPLPAGFLPRCKPGGGGPVPCVASESRTMGHPSVL